MSVKVVVGGIRGLLCGGDNLRSAVRRIDCSELAGSSSYVLGLLRLDSPLRPTLEVYPMHFPRAGCHK